MTKMNAAVKAQRQASQFAKMRPVTNFMGGTSFEVNPLDTLKMVTASSIFGEPAYYRAGEFAEAGVKKVVDGVFRTNSLVAPYSIFGTEFEGKKTSELMEEVIDAALEYNFEAVIDWAVELRNNYYMRLNPQVIMVRAAMHPNRAEFTSKFPDKFSMAQAYVMSRADEPASQLTYWLYRNGSKNGLPSILKRSWAKRIEKANLYEMSKYKNAGIGMIDVVRVAHAKGALVDELMTTGTVAVKEDSQLTWESLKSQGKTWKEILETIRMNHMALLRNLRGIFTEINDVDIANQLMNELKAGVARGKQFPFRYYTAYQVIQNTNGINHKPLILDTLEECIDLAREALPKLNGRVACLSDNSGSAWSAFNSEYGSVTVAEIDNLSSILTAQNADEGYIGVFGDRLEMIPVSKRNGALAQTKEAARKGKNIGGGTENGVWLFFDQAIRNKEHWDTIFIYSDQQAGHGGLYGTPNDAKQYKSLGFGISTYGTPYINVMKLIDAYRREVNPKVNIFTVQTAGYNNVVVPEYAYRTNVLYGWTGKESLFADTMIKFWDEKEVSLPAQ